MSPEPSTSAPRRSGARLVYPVLGPSRDARNFGENRGTHIHAGTDISAPTGTPLRAITAGTVSVKPNNSAAGNTIDLTDSAGNLYRYFHLSRFLVTNGAKVDAGDVIGLVGSTGRSTGPHLHFEYRPGGGAAIDPGPLLDAAERGGPPPVGLASTVANVQGAGGRTSNGSSTRSGFSVLTDPSTWVRVAEFLGGVMLVGVGVFVILDDVAPAATRAVRKALAAGASTAATVASGGNPIAGAAVGEAVS